MRRFTVNFLLLFLFRLSSVFLVWTSFVPDEYWQSLEVAHNIVFKYGYLTWEWKNGLRTYLYPLIFSILYKILQIFHMDFPSAIILVPRLFQAFLTSVSDYYFLHWCQKLGCHPYWTSIAIFTNWFWFYCGSRTIVNAFETSITSIALYHYPWELLYNSSTKSKKIITIKSFYLILAVFICIIRPTAATIWAPLVLLHIIAMDYKHKREFLLRIILPITVFMLSVSVVIDSLLYQKFVITPFEFLKFNLLHGIASFYGVHPFLWYITQGIPVVLALQSLPFTFGCITLFCGKFMRLKFPEESYQNIYKIISCIVIFNIIIFSSIPHKEFRFILPLMPMMQLIGIKFTSHFHYIFKSVNLWHQISIITVQKIWTSLLVISFVIPTVIFGMIHQRGTLSLMNYLTEEGYSQPDKSSFLILMPCHSTPLYSHLHINVTTKFLECEPPLHSSSYDEAEDFFQDPNDWLRRNWETLKSPSHIACFDVIVPLVENFITDKEFYKERIFFHTLFAEGRIGNNVIVYKKRSSS